MGAHQTQFSNPEQKLFIRANFDVKKSWASLKKLGIGHAHAHAHVLASLEVVATFLIIFGVHMVMLIVIKVKIFMLVKWSYRFFQLC